MSDVQYTEGQWPPLIRHLERFLGPIQGGWTSDDAGNRFGVTIAKFADVPVDGATTLSTLGLSAHSLEQPAGRLRQELLFACWDQSGVRNAPGMLAHLADRAIRNHRAYLRGEWDVYAAPVLDGTSLTGFYLGIPAGYSPDFPILKGAYEETTVFVQVFPLSAAEAAYRESAGAAALLERLKSSRADLLDLERPSSV